ncbi:MAG: pilus assembly protein CpaF [Chloroflexota bacterium]|jgi:type IV secretory pathway ATPase VirB11/archaellum biosynthesis ATPase|nr:pilus assembly protein CpaF [Chloroflexota bacterium]
MQQPGWRPRVTEAEELATLPWPDLADFEEIAVPLADAIKAERPPGIRTVAQEESLVADAQQMLDRVITSPRERERLGLNATVAERLQSSRAYYETAVDAIRVRGSFFWPVSRLLYLLKGVEELGCFGYDSWVARVGGQKVRIQGGNPLRNDEDLISLMRESLSLTGVVGSRALSTATPIAESTFGSLLRLSVTIKPAVALASDVQMAIRFPQPTRFRHLDDFVRQGMMPPSVARFMEALVRGRCNVLIAGGTGSGKTTLLRVLSALIPRDEVVVTIEDGAELHLEQDRGDGQPWVQLLYAYTTVPDITQSGGKQSGTDSGHAGIGMRDLVKNALRVTPDRIILGEARGAEMVDVVQAMTTGHDGSMVTIHADSAALAINKARNYMLQSQDFRGQDRLAEEVLQQAIHVVVHLAKSPDGSRRISGILAVDAGGNSRPIYEATSGRGLRRVERAVANLPGRLQERLQPILGDEIPPTE